MSDRLNFLIDAEKTVMTQPLETFRLDYLKSTLWNYRFWVIGPAVAGVVLAACYALFLRSESWSARQSFLVRDDLLGQAYKPGRFESQESMKSAQETILEVSRRPQVIRNTLAQLGPESGAAADDSWVTDQIVEEIQGEIEFSAPNGAEFGKTEVIVLTTKASSRERSKKFIEILSKEIVSQVNEVRSLRFQSMEAELLEARDAAVREQTAAIKELKALDDLLGSDIGVMNSLNDAQAGDTPMKREILQIKDQKRQLELELEANETVLAKLLEVYENPDKVIHLASDVLRQQPALDRLKGDLVGKQSILAGVLGRNHDKHPEVIAARLSVDIVHQHILDSITGEISGLQSTIAMRKNQLARLDREIKALNDRLIVLSEKRTDFLRLTTEVKLLTENANKAQASLSQVQSLANSSRSAGLITPVDGPQVGTAPDGLSKKLVAAAGGFAGLLIGLGFVLVVAPPMDPAPLRLTGTGIEPGAAAQPPHRSQRDNVQATSEIGLAATAIREAADAMKAAASIPRTNSLVNALEMSASEAAARPQNASADANWMPNKEAEASAPSKVADPQLERTSAVLTPQPEPPKVAPLPEAVPPSASQAVPTPRPVPTQQATPTKPIAPEPTLPSEASIVAQAMRAAAQFASDQGIQASAERPAPAPMPTAQPDVNPTVPTKSKPTTEELNRQMQLAQASLSPPPSTRPVDLAKSAESESSFVAQGASDSGSATESSASQQAYKSKTNPFLVPRGDASRSTESFKVDEDSNPQSPAAKVRPDAPTMVDASPRTFADLRREPLNDEAENDRVPDEIRKLTESISQFINRSKRSN